MSTSAPTQSSAAAVAHELEETASAQAAHVENEKQVAAPESNKDTTPALTLTASGSAPSGDAEKRSMSSVAGADDKLPSPPPRTPTPPPKKRGLFGKKPKKTDEKVDASDLIKPVPLFSLYRYATKFELTINFVGLILAAAAGAAAPLMTLIFGRLSNTFTEFSKLIICRDDPSVRGLAMCPQDLPAAIAAAKKMVKHDAGMDAIYLMVIGIGMFLCTYVYMLIWNYTSECQGRRIREKYLRAVMRQEIAYFDDLGAGEVATRIQTDCHLVQQGISEKIPIAVGFLATFITGFVLAYARLPRLAGAMTSILPVIMISGGIMGAAMSKYTTKSLQYVSKGGTIAEEVISSIRTVKAFGTSKVLGENYDKNVQLSRKAGIKGAMVEGSGLSVMFFAIYSAYALAFFYGGILVYKGQANVGQVINAFMSILIGSFSMAMVAPEIQTVTKAQAAAAKLFETIDRVPAIDSADPGGDKPDVVEGRIEFEDVKFHYPSRPNIPILKGLNTTFEAGKTCALVGASGSGKSTVIQLIERFYDPISGVVKLDGRDIRTLNLKWLRQQIGLVSQEPVLFATTVRGNVEHGLIGSKWEDAPDAERFELVKKACIAANADGFISKLPEGYDTVVGERGMLLSGGQKQRVAIARAIVSDPKILLLDEATSALDGLSERVVQDALDKASVGRTTIVVAHRLATIKDADKILVMGGGEILEEGNHNSLLENADGAYAQLVANQKLSQTAAEKAAEDVEYESDDDEIIPASPSSPSKDLKGGYFGGLRRSVTGRSVASALLEEQRRRREEDEAAQEKVPFMVLFKRLLKLNGKHWKWYTVGTIGAVCSGMVYPALAILFGKAMGDFALPGAALKSALREKAQWYFIVAILAAICIWFQMAGFSRTGWELITRLRSLAFKSVMKHDVEWFDEEEHATGAVTSSLSDHPQKVQGLFGVTLGSIVQSCACLVGGIIIGLCYAPLLALVGIACIPLVISSGYIRLRVVVLKEQKVKKWYSASAQLASEATGAVRTVASLTREQDVDKLYQESLRVPFEISQKTAVTSQLLYAASQGITFLAMALIFYVGALWIANEKYSTGTFFTALTATLFSAMQAGNVFMFVPDASSANSGARSIFRLLDNVPEIDDDSPEGIVINPQEVTGHVKLNNIHFRYPSRPGVRVLRNLNVDVPPGKYIALVGPSGCGKSTTIQLLERFYDPQAGTVTLDGVDIREINLQSYRSIFALVSQEPTLYAGTIRFNILLGAAKPMDQVTEDEIVQACKDANIYDFIMSLPDGFETEVGGKGSQLSGGQKQRIAIARALIRDPKILLLDEATAALDSTSERVVQQALDNASKGRSVVAIAHRLSTIQNADIIYFVSEGGVIEKGTHAELIAKGGAYFELVKMQNLSKME